MSIVTINRSKCNEYPSIKWSPFYRTLTGRRLFTHLPMVTICDTKSFLIWGCFQAIQKLSSPHDYCYTVIDIPPTILSLVQWGTSYCRVGIPRIGHLLSCTKGREQILHIDPSLKDKFTSWDIFRQKTILPKKLTCVD